MSSALRAVSRLSERAEEALFSRDTAVYSAHNAGSTHHVIGEVAGLSGLEVGEIVAAIKRRIS